MLSLDNVYTLINYMSVSRWIFLAVAVAVIPYYRWSYPDMYRPFKVSAIIYIYQIYFFLQPSIYFAIWEGTHLF